MKKKGKGYRSKYSGLIETLEDDTLYAPATITDFADKNGFVTAYDPQERRLQLQRIRIHMGRVSSIKELPGEGDGFIRIPGQAPLPAWFGWRWKRAVLSNHEPKIEPSK